MADDPFLAKIAFLDLSIFNVVMTTLDGSMPTCTEAPVKNKNAVHHQTRGERKKTRRQQTMMTMIERA